MKNLASTLMLMLAAGTALAQSDSDEPSFMNLDANADGRISQAEAQADERVSERFEEADADNDGYLSIEEFAAIWR